MALIVPRNKLILRNPQSSGLQSLTPSATIHTKGSYTQLIASLTNPCRALRIFIYSSPGQASPAKNWLIDIATGAAASEVVLIPNLLLSVAAQFYTANAQILVPCRIPAGTRIAARVQCDKTSSSDTPYVCVEAYDANITQVEGGSGFDDLGTNTGTSSGTAITPGNSSSKSAYSQLIASTSRAYKGIFALMGQTAAGSSYDFLLTDVATGGSGSETAFIVDHIANSWDSYMRPNEIPFHRCQIPAGSRISARMAATGTGVAKVLAAYGVY